MLDRLFAAARDRAPDLVMRPPERQALEATAAATVSDAMVGDLVHPQLDALPAEGEMSPIFGRIRFDIKLISHQ
ncbi:hypothetical protein Pmi06nite_57970 [Planotetraspora mira]|uniref:Uncharacterized protein n=1 Tax=Planotetraspora mira TaxID=58121 RepID=A0A8J3U400_9ACTN|nr:hypothetical protein Pmi06nite_57970 [Planotetraspora mira]